MRKRFGLRFSEADDIKKLKAVDSIATDYFDEIFKVAKKYRMKARSIYTTLSNKAIAKGVDDGWNKISYEVGRLVDEIDRFGQKLEMTIDKLK